MSVTLKAPTQSLAYRCDCGASVAVSPVTAYEFSWRCACGRAGVISWFHGSAPPVFHPEELPLFTSSESA